MDKIKILFSFQPWVDLRKYIEECLKDLTNIELIYPKDTERQTIEALISDVDVLFGWRPWKELIEKAQKLKLIIQPGTGAESLVEVMKHFTTRNIISTNGHGHSYGCAQHMVALLHALTNHIIPYHSNMVNGRWREKGPESYTLRDKKIGLLGYGPINQWVHKFLQGYDLSFSILKRSWANNVYDFSGEKYTQLELHAFLSSIEILLIALPLTDTTKGIIGAKELELLGPSGLLVTVARGQIIDQEKLFHSLKSNRIAGAAIDVWYNYSPDPVDEKLFPYDQQFPFHTLKNVVLSPHRAGSLRGDLRRWDENIDNIRRLAMGRSDFINVIDMKLGY